MEISTSSSPELPAMEGITKVSLSTMFIQLEQDELMLISSSRLNLASFDRRSRPDSQKSSSFRLSRS